MSILRADSIRDRAGTGAPDFPNGATVTGVVTATSFAGNVTGNVLVMWYFCWTDWYSKHYSWNCWMQKQLELLLVMLLELMLRSAAT